MDKLRKLYDSYKEQGLISEETSFEQFSSADDTIKNNLYKSGVENKVISGLTDFDTFNSAWQLDEPEKVKTEAVATEAAPVAAEEAVAMPSRTEMISGVKPEDMVSTSEDTSLDIPETKPKKSSRAQVRNRELATRKEALKKQREKQSEEDIIADLEYKKSLKGVDQTLIKAGSSIWSYSPENISNLYSKTTGEALDYKAIQNTSIIGPSSTSYTGIFNPYNSVLTGKFSYSDFANKEKINGISISELQEADQVKAATSVLETIIEEHGEKSDDFVINQGQAILKGKDKKLQELYSSLRIASAEEKQSILDQIETVRQDNSQELFDINTGNLVKYDKLTEQSKKDYDAIVEEADEKASTTELSQLKKELTNSYSNLVGISKRISSFVDENGEDEITKSSQTTQGQLFSLVKDFFGSEETTYGDLSRVQEIANTGILPENVSKISGEHPLVNAYNTALQEYAILNKAVQTNTDPLSEKQEGFWESIGIALEEKVDVTGGDPVPKIKANANKLFIDSAKKAGLEGVSQEEVDEAVSQNWKSVVGGGTVDLTLFVGELALFKGGTGNKIAKGFKYIDEIFKASKAAKSSKIFRKAGDFVIKGLDEAAVFTGLEATKSSLGLSHQATREQEWATAKFGFALGGGNSLGAGILRAIPVKTMFSPVIAQLSKSDVLKDVGTRFVNANAGAFSFEFATALEALQNPENKGYGPRGDKGYFQQNPEEYFLHYTGEVAKMGLLGSKSIFHKNGIYKAAQRDMRLLNFNPAYVNSAAKRTGINPESVRKPGEETINEIDAARAEKMSGIDAKLKTQQITEDQAKKEIDAANKDYNILEAEAELNLAKDRFNAEDKSALKPTDESVRILIQKMKRGDKFNDKDNNALVNTPLPIIYARMGADPSNRTLEDMWSREFAIEDIMNNNISFKAPYGSKERADSYKFLDEFFEVGGRKQYLLKIKNRNEVQEKELQQLEKDFKNYEPGGYKYDKFQDKLDQLYLKQRLANKVQAKDVLSATQEGESVSIRKAQDFQDKYNSIAKDGQDVTSTDGFYDAKEKTFYINEEVVKYTRNVTVDKHEVGHFILRDSLKDKYGKVTDDGIKVIDEVLSELTPKQRDVVQKRIDGAYKYDKKGKERPVKDYYEEYLTVLSDAITEKQIVFKDNVGNAFEKLVPFLRKKMPELELNADTGKNLFELIKSYSKGEEAGTEAAKRMSIAAEGKDTSEQEIVPLSKLSDLKKELQEIDEFDYDNEFEFEQAVSSLESRISRLEKSEKASAEKEVVTKPKVKEVVENTKEVVEKASNEVFEKLEVSDKNKQIAKTNEDIVNEMSELGVNSVSEIKDPAKKKAIIDKLGKNNLGAVTELTKKAAAIGKDLIIDDNLKVSYDEFFSGFSEELASLIRTYKVDVDGKKVPFGAYMNKNLRLRYGQILNKALQGRVQGAASLDAESGSVGSVKEIAAEGSRDFDAYTSADKGLPAGELIDVTNFTSIKDKVDAVRDVVNLEGVDVADLTYKKVVDDYAGPAGAEIIGLHDKNAQPEKGQDKNNFQKLAERIDGTRTLNYGKGINGEAEVRAMQKLFIDYNDMLKFIKTIPEFNVAPFETTIDKQGRSIDLTTDAKGYSVGTSNVLLIQLYDVYVDPKSKSTDKAIKGRSITSPSGRGKGKTSQVSKVYRLKDKYRGRIDRKAVKELQKIIGITEAGEAFIPMKGVNRTLFGTALQGLTKIYAANAANTIIRKDIVGKGITSDKKSTEKVLADIGGGKSSVMFSKTVDLLNNINKKPYKEFKGGLREKRAVMFDVVSDITIKKGVDAGSIALNELKKIRSVFKYEYVNAGFLNAMTDLKSKVKNSTPEESEQLVIDFLRFISRSARTSKGKNLQYVSTNKKMFNEAVASVLGEDNNFSLSQITIMEDGKPKDVNVIKFKGKRLRGFTDVTAIKKDRFSPIINEEADMARTVVLNKIDTLKHRLKTDPNFTKEMFDTQLESFLSLASLDQRGLIRKMSKTNAQVEGKFKATDLYLEHKMSALEITEKLKEYANSEISIEDLQKTLDEEALVNLMPKSLAKALPDFKAERSKNPSYKNSSGYKTKKYLNKLKELNLSIVDIDGNIETPAGDRVVFSKNLNETFNKIIENKKGILAGETFSEVKAKLMANSKRKFNIFVPPSAEDFVGLLYATLGKGKVGDKQMDFYKKALLKPYARAMEAIRRDRLDLGKAFKEIKKQFNTTPKDLKKKLPDSLFNREQAVRVFIWDSVGKEVPGLSKAETKELVDYVSNDPKLKEFAEQVTRLNPGSRYTSPSETWSTGNITTDLLETMNESRRAKHLGRWQQNVDAIFTKDNLNKLEAAYGTSYRKAMENILTRMKTGRNRTYGSDSQTSKWIDWVNGSVGAIMFFNARSSVLQTLSATNFINFGDNNIFAAGKAFANQKQYWSDFARLINSEFLLDRRDSLKINVNEADIAEAASKNGVRGAINYILKLGFTPTKFADSFAIAIGGSTFYRNRMNALIKKGMDPVAAEKVAMRDFIETAEESQQSSRPDKISQEQAGSLGRIVLAFANTPAQYTRIIKKAASDLKNRRGSDRENISKIVYYGMAQNLIFNTLQQALFAIAFGNEEEEEDLLDEKKLNVVNGMLDSFMRGAGVGGAVLSTIKNTGLRIYKESQKDRPKYENAATEVLKISPPISSKFGKVVSAGKTLSWDMKEIKEKGFDITSPAVKAGAQVITAGTNLPLDRVVKKVENLAAASNEELETYKRIALALGWSKWELGIKDPKKKKTKKKGRNTTTRRTVTRKTIIR